MNEKELKELGAKLIAKQIELAKLKGTKGKVSEIVHMESESIELKRAFNAELDKLSKAKKVDISTDE